MGTGQRQLEYGRQILKAYRRRCSDKEYMNYHANRDHHHRRHTSALVAAHKFLEMNMYMTDAANAHQFQQQLQSFVQRVAGMARLPESDVLVVPWIKLAAPVYFPADEGNHIMCRDVSQPKWHQPWLGPAASVTGRGRHT